MEFKNLQSNKINNSSTLNVPPKKISYFGFLLLTLSISTNSNGAAIHIQDVEEIEPEYTIIDAARKGDINLVLTMGFFGRIGIDKSIIEILSASDCDINAINTQYGETVLMRAVFFDRGYQEELIKLIIDKGADINAGDQDKCTALMHAVQKNQKNIVQLLLDLGADFTKINSFQKTALDLAKVTPRAVLMDENSLKTQEEIIQMLENEPARRQAAISRRERLIAQLNNTIIPPVLVRIINAYLPEELRDYIEATEKK